MADGKKNIAVKANIQEDYSSLLVDYGLTGHSVYETAPRHSIFYTQGGTPDSLIAPTDPYWFVKSGASQTGKEGFAELGIGQNTTFDQTDASLTAFIRAQLDSTSGEGEIKIKPSLWFYPSSEPITPQIGMVYFDTTAGELKVYSGTWQSLTTGSGMSAHDLTGSYHTEDATGGAGRFLKSDSDTTFSWQAHGLTASDVGAVDTTTYGSHDHSTGDPTQVSYTDLTNIPSTFTPTAHNLIDTTGHPVSGLTTGHFLKATGATTYAFGAHGLTASDVGAYTTAQTDTAIDTDISTHTSVASAHHNPVTVASAPLTLSTQEITFNYDTHHFQLSGNNIQLGTESPSSGEYLKWDGTNTVWETPPGAAETFKKDTTYYASHWVPIELIGFDSLNGSLGALTNVTGVFGKLMTQSSGFCGYFTGSVMCPDAKATSAEMRIWYKKTSGTTDLVAINTTVGYLQNGTTCAWNVSAAPGVNLYGTNQARYAPVSLSDADITGGGIFTFRFRFELLADNAVYILGVQIVFTEDHDGA